MFAAAAVAAWAAAPAVALAAPPAAASAPIYSCVDTAGRRLSADRPIPECLSQEQRLLNRDGSQRGVAPPLLSPDERARRDKARRDAEQAQARKDEAVRRDRNLLARYPLPLAHDEARARALTPTLQQIEKAQDRLAALAAQAGALATERVRLGSQPVPESLRDRIGSNEGATNAQESILRNQEAERDRLNQQFDVERARLELLWRGQAPGTLDDKLPRTAGAASAAAAD
ncbi:MAG TPA: hypothetical protein VLA16_00920 [Ideonella sp.]|nr:hypothetical protein [Ideonella sp.]